MAHGRRRTHLLGQPHGRRRLLQEGHSPAPGTRHSVFDTAPRTRTGIQRGILENPHLLGMYSRFCAFLCTNSTNYQRFRRIYREATNPAGGYTGPVSAETALWYRDVYRRYRDYSILATVGFYLLQVIDANVFAYMHDFEVSDDISMRLEPAVIAPDNAYAFGPMPSSPMENAIGLRFGLRF